MVLFGKIFNDGASYIRIGMADTDETTAYDLIDEIPDEVAGQILKKGLSTGLVDVQNNLRQLGERFIQRNAIFTAKVQSKNRITIPGPEAEKLDLEKGDLVQVGITPVESVISDNQKED